MPFLSTSTDDQSAITERQRTLKAQLTAEIAHSAGSDIRKLGKSVMRLARPAGGGAMSESIKKQDTAKQKLALFSGVANLAEWQALLADKDELIHTGGFVGDISVANCNVSVSELTKCAVAYILSSNAAVITRKTQIEAAEAAARSLLIELGRALRLVKERALKASVAADVLQLVAKAVQECEQINLLGVVPDKRIVADASQETFGMLLRSLWTQSDRVRCVIIQVLMILNATEARSTQANALVSITVLLQMAACGLMVVECIQSLHAVAVTARHISTMSSAPQPQLSTDTSRDWSKSFWSEMVELRSKALPGSGGSLPVVSWGRAKGAKISQKVMAQGNSGTEPFVLLTKGTLNQVILGP